MNNLTELWKKGELPEGFYYVRCAWSDEVEIRYVHNGVDDWQEIVAPVPSYEEWQEKNKALTALLSEYGKVSKELQEEKWKNAKKPLYCEPMDYFKEYQKLKELLKECRDELEGEFGIGAAKLVDEIDEVLK